jgi:hypothetical protein
MVLQDGNFVDDLAGRVLAFDMKRKSGACIAKPEST